jgi:hypothetical protein
MNKGHGGSLIGIGVLVLMKEEGWLKNGCGILFLNEVKEMVRRR